jgi:hypothetical protein
MSEGKNIEQMLAESVLMHLSDTELGAFFDNTIDEIDRYRMENHMSRCMICSRKLETMRDVLQSKHEHVSDDDIVLAKRLLNQVLVVTALIQSVALAFSMWAKRRRVCPGMRPTFSAEKIEDGQTEDGVLRWRYVEKDSGERLIRFGSHRMELEGLKIHVNAGQYTKVAVLNAVAPDQLGAEVSFSTKECEKIPPETILSIDVDTVA